MFRATRQIFDKSKTVQAANGVAQTVTMQAPLVPMQNKWIRRGYVLMNRGDMIGAISEFSQALLANHRDTEAYIGRGKAFLSTGGYDLAMRDACVAIGISPENAMAYAIRGAVYHALSSQRVEDKDMLLNAALEDLNRAVALDPNCAEAYKHRAVVYATLDGDVLETSRGSRAVYDAYLSLTLNPNYAPAKG
jgi:tetratricopeptide (TPR) repeat protein